MEEHTVYRPQFYESAGLSGTTAETRLREAAYGDTYATEQLGYPPPQTTGDEGAGWPVSVPEKKEGGDLRIVIAGLSVLLVALLGVVGYVVLIRGRGADPVAGGATGRVTQSATLANTSPDGGTPRSSPAAETSSATAAPTSQGSGDTATKTKSAGQLALAELTSLRRASLQQVQLDGHWVLQMASKSSGIRDNSQVAENGSHIFYYADILAEYRAIERRANGAGYSTMMLLGSDFGATQNANNRRIWVTIIDPGGIPNVESARYFCARFYPGLSGPALDNVCLPRKFLPPGG